MTAGGPGLVAVGFDNTNDNINAAVWTSVDGITWSRVPHDDAVFGGDSDPAMISVTAGGPGLVAVGSDGVDGSFDSLDAAVWTSVDGITWSRVPHDDAVFGGSDGGQRMRSVAAGGPGLVAVGRDEASDDINAAVWTSVDGITWSRVPHDDAVFGGDGDQTMSGVAAGGPGLVAVGGGGPDGDSDAAVWTSVDGITWSRVPSRRCRLRRRRQPDNERRGCRRAGAGGSRIRDCGRSFRCGDLGRGDRRLTGDSAPPTVPEVPVGDALDPG